jgi:flagellar hook-basal body protein
MPNYSIGLSGLQQSSNAMDVVSNNIANAATVGYRAGEFIFEDQFYKAMNPMDPARSGMGTAKQNIRRLWNMGAIQQSANTLDMAITGSMGLFRLTSNVDDPAQTYYTRNGQFAISKEVDPSYPKRSYIVNENGMFLTGYTSSDGRELTSTHTHRLSMPPVSIDPVTTENSTVSVTLDARKTAFIPEANISFDPEVPSSYNNKVSQTVYHLGDSGNPHTLELYYRRVEDKNMTVTWDGTYLKYEPNAMADPKASTEPDGGIVESNKSYVVLTQESSGPNFDYLTSADRKTYVSSDVADDIFIPVDQTANIDSYARVIVNGQDLGVVVRPVADHEIDTSAATADTPETSTVFLSGHFAVGDKISVTILGTTMTYTVTEDDIAGAPEDSAAVLEAVVTNVVDLVAAEFPDFTVEVNADNTAAFDITGDTDDEDLRISVNLATTGLFVSGDGVSVNEEDEIQFFNPMTAPLAIVDEAGDPIATAIEGTTTVIISAPPPSALKAGQFIWKQIGDGTGVPPYTYERLDAKVIEVSGKTLTLSKGVDLNADEMLIFYEPVTYTVILQDGSKVAMVGDHKQSTSATNTQEFIAVTSTVEVYGSLDGTMFNGTDSRFSSDTDLNSTVTGTYDPLAVMQFWGGQNIDAIRFDAVTGEPAFRSLVQLKGIVTSSGKTNGALGTEISEDHPLEFDLDLTGTRHFATSFAVDANYQDGYATSMLNNVTIDPEGKIVGTYSDGREFLAGQLVLVNFAAVNGLVPTGNNVFQASYMSGSEVNENVIVGKPGERGLGGIRAGSYEGSNVDLANELVKLLIMQRMYSANSQSIRAFDDTLTTTIRMTGG